MRRTKIVCTLGPSTDEPAMLATLIDAGMDVARFNFSHGTHADHRRRLAVLREAGAAAGVEVGAMADLAGPKIRIGRFSGGSVTLEPGQRFTITARPVDGDGSIVSTTHSLLAADVSKGDSILLADGLLELSVLAVEGTDVVCKVVVGGRLSDRKGINLPHAHVSAPSLTEKDLADLAIVLAEGFDLVALSFVRRPDDVRELRRRVREAGADTLVVAKIEKPQAIVELEEIIGGSDAVMVARGDLGVEMPPESVPAIQKRIIHLCRRAGVPVITATQMLESMIENPRPTRAEASDVANAIFDGTDAVMLSGETASGRYPDRACQMMVRIAKVAEIQDPSDVGEARPASPPAGRGEAVAESVCRAASGVGAQAIVTYTADGGSARQLARHRPLTPVLALTPSRATARRLAPVWGVRSVVVEPIARVDDLFARAGPAAVKAGLARPGDTVVVAARVPLGEGGPIDMLQVQDVEGP